MNIRPLKDQIAIRRDPRKQASEGGILLSPGATDKAETGTVVSTGAGKVLEDGTIRPMTVKAGDRVIFSEGGSEITIGNETLVVLREQDIVGILT